MIAIVGQGRMAQVHARVWSSLGLGEKIRYVCTLRPGAPLEHAAAARFVTDLDVVLSDHEVEIVSVCTPTPTHADISIRALNAGKNVLLEKPIALTLQQAIAIRDAAAASRGILMVAQVVRFFAGYRVLREAVEAGSIGTALSARAVRITSATDTAPWLRDESQSGGVLVDFAVHDFDQLNLFLGTPGAVTAVRATEAGPVETTVDYREGGIGQVQSFMSMPAGTPFTSSLELLGTRGVAGYQFSGRPAGVPGVPAGSGIGATGHEGKGISVYRLVTAAETSLTTVGGDDPYARQAEYFLHCVESGESPTLCPVDAAIAALSVSLAARESLATSTRIVIPSC